MEKVKLKFYEIDRCGYYKYSDENPHLTNIADVLDNLKEWISNKTLQQTQTTSFLSKSERLPVYCVNVTKSTNKNTYLLVTWNKSESVDGNISSIHKDQDISSLSSSVSTSLPEGHIPGYATYFWIIPEDNILATIRFNHRSNGHSNMNIYLKGFLSRFSKYVKKTEDPNEKGHFEILGYSKGEEEADSTLNPYFNSKLKKLDGNIDVIKSKREKITKVIRKTLISHVPKTKTSLWDRIFDNIGYNTLKDKNEPLEMKYEISTTLEKKELNDIIDSWSNNTHEDNWDDIGFKIKGENLPLWLKSEIPSEEIGIDVKRTDDEFIDFNKFLVDLESRLNLLRKIYQRR